MSSALGGVFGTTKKPSLSRVAKHNPAGMYHSSGRFMRATNEPPGRHGKPDLGKMKKRGKGY